MRNEWDINGVITTEAQLKVCVATVKPTKAIYTNNNQYTWSKITT